MPLRIPFLGCWKDERLKIVLSVDALSTAMTGIGRYTWELAKELERSDEIAALRFFSRTRFVDTLPTPRAESGVETTPRGRLRRRILRAGYRAIGPAIQAVSFQRHRDWLFHATNFYLPPFPGAKVVTIHDLSVLHFPDYHPADRVAHLAAAIPDALRRADRILTDSEHVRQELLERFGIEGERVSAVPLACGPEYHPRSRGETEATLGRFGLRHGSYSLFVGTIEPRKNIDLMLDAYAVLPASLRKEFPFVVAGHPGWKSESLHTRLSKAEEEGWLRYLGYVDVESLPALFAGARCFVYPSLYEGFGLPLLEAMASGVPCVTVPNSSMEEIAGTSVLYCRPNECESLAVAIETLLINEEEHGKKRGSGLERAGCFSWKNTARKTIDVYRVALASR